MIFPARSGTRSSGSGSTGNPPYNYILYTAPNRVPRSGHWHTLSDDFHWHLEIIRVSPVAGFEWGSGFLHHPTPPEDAANTQKREALTGR